MTELTDGETNIRKESCLSLSSQGLDMNERSNIARLREGSTLALTLRGSDLVCELVHICLVHILRGGDTEIIMPI